MRILVGLGLALVGFLMVWKAEWIYENFGTVAWAETHIHSEGGSRLFYKLLGLGLILLGFSTATGLLAQVGKALLPRFFYGG